MRRRTGVLLGVGAGALVIVGVGLAVWLLTRPPGPEQTAEAYLRALESGDAAAALALLDEDVDGQTASSAFDGATALPAEGSIGEFESPASDDPAVVPISFALDGQPVEAELRLVDTAAGWRITQGGVGTASLATSLGDAVRVGGVLVTATDGITLLPAIYPVTAAPAGILEGSTTLTVLPGAPAEASVTAVPSPQATALAQEQLDAYLAECTRAAAAIPANCGIRVPWAADLTSLTNVAFRIDTAPVLALAPDGASFAATGGVLVATATGAARSGGTAEFTYRADDWALRGTVSYAGDEMVLAVR